MVTEPTVDDLTKIALEILAMAQTNKISSILDGTALTNPAEHPALNARLGEIHDSLAQHHDCTIAMYLRMTNPGMIGTPLPNWKLLYEAGWERASPAMRADAYYGLDTCYKEYYHV